MKPNLQAGAAHVDITPKQPQFLYGYPHVPRFSTGVHDPLFASALYLADGRTRVLFVASDIIWVPKALAARARVRIAGATGVPADGIMIAATHTHSGPIMIRYLSNEADPAVPEPDPAYLAQLEDGIVAAGVQAATRPVAAEVGLTVADGAGLGTNRRDPRGPCDTAIPVLAARARGGKMLGVMLVCAVHPTVLHEDSTLISGDFPGLARRYLQQQLGAECPILHHLGAAGNQSTRHVVAANTFAEAQRLGETLGCAVEGALDGLDYRDDLALACRHCNVDLPLRQVPSVAEAQTSLAQVRARLEALRQAGAPRAEMRTAECDWFGAEETLTLAKAAQSGRLETVAATCLPAEVQVIRVGPWAFVGWPGEVFVEYAHQLRRQFPHAYLITLANGELQGYLVTAEAAAEGGYEASNALFASPESGARLLRATAALLADLA